MSILCPKPLNNGMEMRREPKACLRLSGLRTQARGIQSARFHISPWRGSTAAVLLLSPCWEGSNNRRTRRHRRRRRRTGAISSETPLLFITRSGSRCGCQPQAPENANFSAVRMLLRAAGRLCGARLMNLQSRPFSPKAPSFFFFFYYFYFFFGYPAFSVMGALS